MLFGTIGLCFTSISYFLFGWKGILHDTLAEVSNALANTILISRNKRQQILWKTLQKT